MTEEEHRECRAYDAQQRAALVRQIATASAAAHKQAQRSLATAIRTMADGKDVRSHIADVHAARQLRCVLLTLGHEPITGAPLEDANQ